MRYVVMAWVGPTMTGHGSASCIECGWAAQDRFYGNLALRVLAHEETHKSPPHSEE